MHYLEYALDHDQHTIADYDALESEFVNIFTAIDQARAFGDWSSVIQIIYPLLEGSLRERGYWKESVKYGYVLIEAAERLGDKEAEGWAWIIAIGWTLIQQGNHIEGRRAVERGLKAFYEAGYEWGIWSARRFLGQAYHIGGDLVKARAIYLSALQDANVAYSIRFPTPRLLKQYVDFVRHNWRQEKWQYHQSRPERRQGSRLDVGRCLDALSITGRFLYHREKWTWSAFTAKRKADYQGIKANYYIDLGNLAHAEGKLNEARTYYNQALALFRQLGREMEIGIVLNNMAHLVRCQEMWAEARHLYMQSLEISQRFGRRFSIAETYLGLAEVEFVQGNVENAKKFKELARDTCLSLGIDYQNLQTRLGIKSLISE